MKKTIAMLALATLMSVLAFGQNPPATTSGDNGKMTKSAPKKAKAKAKAKSETQPASTTPTTAPAEKKGKGKK